MGLDTTAIKSLIGGVGADTVLECVGTGDSMRQAGQSTRPRGCVLMPHDLTLHGIKMLFSHVVLRGGTAPVRRFLLGADQARLDNTGHSREGLRSRPPAGAITALIEPRAHLALFLDTANLLHSTPRMVIRASRNRLDTTGPHPAARGPCGPLIRPWRTLRNPWNLRWLTGTCRRYPRDARSPAVGVSGVRPSLCFCSGRRGGPAEGCTGRAPLRGALPT